MSFGTSHHSDEEETSYWNGHDAGTRSAARQEREKIINFLRKRRKQAVRDFDNVRVEIIHELIDEIEAWDS